MICTIQNNQYRAAKVVRKTSWLQIFGKREVPETFIEDHHWGIDSEWVISRRTPPWYGHFPLPLHRLFFTPDILSVIIKFFKLFYFVSHCFLQVLLSDWFQQIRSGYLDCPLLGCTKTFLTVIELTDHVKEKCNWGRFNGTVICTHCEDKVHCDKMKSHWAVKHSEVISFFKRALVLQTVCQSIISQTFYTIVFR